MRGPRIRLRPVPIVVLAAAGLLLLAAPSGPSRPLGEAAAVVRPPAPAATPADMGPRCFDVCTPLPIAALAPSVAHDCPGVPVTPGMDLQSTINASGTGTTFCLAPGTYRLSTSLAPKTGDTLSGSPGAVLSGATVLGSWSGGSGQWVHTGDTKNPGTLVGSCADGTDACRYPDDVFVDGARMTRVLSLSKLAPGTAYLDYGANKVYLGQDPTGSVVEYAVTKQAFVDNGATGVTLSGLVVEKFANPAQTAAVQIGANWVVDGCEIRDNHGVGVALAAYSPSTIRDSHVHDQGQMGMSGWQSVDGLVEDNEIDHNNVAGYDYWWEAGGAKWTYTTDLTVRGNFSHDNTGPGLWTDIDNVGTTYDSNTVQDNAAAGIFHEISYSATIVGNVVSGNGFDVGWVWGAGIMISSSGGTGVTINGNTVEDNAQGIMLVQEGRGSGKYGTYLTQNVVVEDNDVTMCTGTSGAAVGTGGSNNLFGSQNNDYRNNDYEVKTTGGQSWQWDNGTQSWSSWQGFGQDLSGSKQTATGC